MKVVVVGGGVMGASSAWRLAARGHDVTLLEQFEQGHARGASHGTSRIFRHAYADDYYVSLAAQAYSRWRELETATDITVLTLTGAVDHGLPDIVKPRVDALARAGLASEVLDPFEAHDRWPGLKFDTTVLFHPDAGRLHADRSVAALHAAASALGADIRFGEPVREIRAREVGGTTVVTDTATYDADIVVLSAGAWTDTFDLGLDLPKLVTTQEQPAHFAPISSPSSSDTLWPSFIHHPGADLRTEGIYGLASGDGVKIGEHGTGPVVHPDRRDFTPDPAGVERLKDYAREWLPGVDADSADPLTCLYTTTPDSNFVVDRSGGIVVAGGFSGHGFKFAPAVGDLVADLSEGTASANSLFRLGARA